MLESCTPGDISLPPGCTNTCAGKVVNRIGALIQAKNTFSIYLLKDQIRFRIQFARQPQTHTWPC